MKIREDLPFTFCNSCPEFILDVNEQVIFGGDEVAAREIIVRCRNERLCRRLKDMKLEDMKHE